MECGSAKLQSGFASRGAEETVGPSGGPVLRPGRGRAIECAIGAPAPSPLLCFRRAASFHTFGHTTNPACGAEFETSGGPKQLRFRLFWEGADVPRSAGKTLGADNDRHLERGGQSPPDPPSPAEVRTVLITQCFHDTAQSPTLSGAYRCFTVPARSKVRRRGLRGEWRLVSFPEASDGIVGSTPDPSR